MSERVPPRVVPELPDHEVRSSAMFESSSNVETRQWVITRPYLELRKLASERPDPLSGSYQGKPAGSLDGQVRRFHQFEPGLPERAVDLSADTRCPAGRSPRRPLETVPA